MFYGRSPRYLTHSRLVAKEACSRLIEAAGNFVGQLPYLHCVNDLIQALDAWIIKEVRPGIHQIVIGDRPSQSFYTVQRPASSSEICDPPSNAFISPIPKASPLIRFFEGQFGSKPFHGQHIYAMEHPVNPVPQDKPVCQEALQAQQQMREAKLELAVPFYCQNRLMGWLALGSKSDGSEYSVQDAYLICDMMGVFGLFLERAFHSEMEALLGNIPRGIAHDMRNWLSPVSACIQLQMEGADESQAKIKKILPSAIQGIELWNYFLSRSKHYKIDNTQWKLIRIDEIVQRAIQGFKVGSKFAAIILKRPIAAKVSGDEALLLRLFGNLISNAVRFSPETGEVIVSMELIDKHEGKPSLIGIYVADQGPGIVPELHRAIYQPSFVTFNEEKQINKDGLGLAICRQIAYVHGGWLTLEKNEGGGARIGFELPCRNPGDFLDKP